jgi:hypothetical protein
MRFADAGRTEEQRKSQHEAAKLIGRSSFGASTCVLPENGVSRHATFAPDSLPPSAAITPARWELFAGNPNQLQSKVW